MIDQFGRCSDPAYFCAGNLLRPAETSGFCWQEGIETARRVARDLERGNTVDHGVVRIKMADPALRFVVPQRINLSGAAGGMTHLYLGLNGPMIGTMAATAGADTLWKGRLNTQPVRRTQIPLDGIVRAAPAQDVVISSCA